MKMGPLPSPEPRGRKGSTQEEHEERFGDFSKGSNGNSGNSVEEQGTWRKDENGHRPRRDWLGSGDRFHAQVDLQVVILTLTLARPDKTQCTSFPPDRESLGGLILCLPSRDMQGGRDRDCDL